MDFRLRALCLALVLGSCASPRTNLSGTWKLNASKAHPVGGMEGLTIKFDQRGRQLHESITTTTAGSRAEIHHSLNYTTDGKQSINQLDGQDVTCRAWWEGTSLVTEWGDGRRAFRRQFTLAEGGKTMTMTVHHLGMGEEPDESVVLERQ